MLNPSVWEQKLHIRDYNLNASHAGLLVHYRLKNKQKLKDVETLYLNEPQYMKSL
jgi:hypothetical protein